MREVIVFELVGMEKDGVILPKGCLVSAQGKHMISTNRELVQAR